MALCRGRILVPIRAMVKETYGEAGWKRLLSEMQPKDREVIDGLILPDAWYDRGLHARILETAYRLWIAETPDLGKRFGQRAARHGDRFYLRPLLKLGGPLPVVKRAAAIYRDYFQGGEMSVTERRDTGARMELRDAAAPREYCTDTFPAFVEELIVLTGRTPLRVQQVVCRFEGADHCEYDIEWK